MEIHDIGSFIPYLDKLRERTLRVASRIPREQLEWRHKDGAFSFGDLLRHLGAIERYMFAENARLRPSLYPGHGRELADGWEEVFAFLARTRAETKDILLTLTPADLRKKCTTPGGTEITVWKWLRALTEHEIHHRGQIYVFLALLGIPTEPIYGLTSEEVRERSAPR